MMSAPAPQRMFAQPAAFLAPLGASIHALRREIDRIFDQAENTGAAHQIRLDMIETDAEIQIFAETPGIDLKDVDIEVCDGMLSIRAEKRCERDEVKGDQRLAELAFGAFERTLRLPEGVDPAAIKAVLTNGVLRVTVPKPPVVKAPVNKIAVTRV